MTTKIPWVTNIASAEAKTIVGDCNGLLGNLKALATRFDDALTCDCGENPNNGFLFITNVIGLEQWKCSLWTALETHSP